MCQSPIDGNEKEMYRPVILHNMKKFTLVNGTTTK